ncbi:hypothetical protein F5Y19DRAFT_491334 [Xylariaceae sp. FL1651]|nr:hypothetical protein F5Y19DRAFT_491334 [Xylariaceae sp. FL1651]
MASLASLDGFQDFIGQLPMLKTYLHFTLGFRNTRPELEADIIINVTKAALLLAETFPWSHAKVINTGRREGNSGVFRLSPCPQFEGTILRKVKDCKELFPTYDEILASKACLKVLDGDLLAPRTAFPLSYEESEDDPAPVLALQLNLVRGGILVHWACQHNIMDAAGLGQVVKLFSYAMRQESFPKSAAEWGNYQPRRELIPLLGPGEQQLEHGHLRRAAVPHPITSPAPFMAFQWCDFRFSSESLKALKKLASNRAEFADPSSTSVSFVSTNDALTAFCWQYISQARIKLGRDPDSLCKLARAMDVRAIMGVSPEYMGHMIYIATSHIPLKVLANKPLAYVSSVLRQDLLDASTSYEVRSFATMISNTEDKSTIAFAGDFKPDYDLGTSSGLGLQYRFDYGVLGNPDFMQRPRFTPIPSTLYIMPTSSDGGVDVQLSLKQDELSALREDETWSRYAKIHLQ